MNCCHHGYAPGQGNTTGFELCHTVLLPQQSGLLQSLAKASQDQESRSRLPMHSVNRRDFSRSSVSARKIWVLADTYWKSVDDGNEREELQSLQERLDGRIRVRPICLLQGPSFLISLSPTSLFFIFLTDFATPSYGSLCLLSR
jgi:hypothetical protein